MFQTRDAEYEALLENKVENQSTTSKAKYWVALIVMAIVLGIVLYFGSNHAGEVFSGTLWNNKFFFFFFLNFWIEFFHFDFIFYFIFFFETQKTKMPTGSLKLYKKHPIKHVANHGHSTNNVPNTHFVFFRKNKKTMKLHRKFRIK